ncbi:MAG: immunity protein 19, partial [Oscillospiraceae bacterium]|nr:immunity protein 19 [Oscillospiraceae bacterium]
EIENNPDFWLYFLSVSFPLAYDETEDIALADFIYENYVCESDASEWVSEFVQYSENIMQTNDGYAENPTSVRITANQDEYIIQYHAGDTLYFKNQKEIASTGAHYDIHKIAFEDFIKINRECGLISALLLPIVWLDESEINDADALIQIFLDKIPVKEEHRSQITDMIIEGLKL